MKRKEILAAASTFFLFFTGLLFAQYQHHPPSPTPTPLAPSKAPPNADPHAGHSVEKPGQTQPHAKQPGKESERNLFQSDMALMTGMTPEDPMDGMGRPGWAWHVVGLARLSYNDQGGPSGDSAIESSNWNMVMVQREIGPGRATFMLMNSLEPGTIPEEGSPELFQTGESFEDRPLVDRQHPHDFFMNLSATYRVQLASRAAAWIQIAPVGEPALGPAAFMHRASSGENPTSPLGHHWQDSTHISYNVGTLGWGWRWLSLESSVFHGEEPDEERWNIDGGKPDSLSGRVTLRFPEGWSAQISHGYLHEPEALEEGDTHRTTASIHYGAAGDRPLAATLLWGRNNEEHGTSDSYLLEGAYQLTAEDQVYGRAEYVEKDFELLRFKGEPHIAIVLPEIAEIGALTLGYLRSFNLTEALNLGVEGVNVGAGADLTAYSFPSELERVYGDFPVSLHLFLRLRWGKQHGAGHAMTHAH